MRTVNHDYDLRGRPKLDGAKHPWAVGITAIRANEVVRQGTQQTPCIFNRAEPLSSSNIYFAFGELRALVFLLLARVIGYGIL